MNVYMATMEDVSVSAAKQLLRVSAPSDAVLWVLAAGVSNTDREADEMLGVKVLRVSTDGTGTSETPLAYNEESPAFPGTAVKDLSADGTAGDLLLADSFHIKNGWRFFWTPDTRPRVAPSGRIALRLDDAPGAATVLNAWLLVGIE